MKDNDHKRMYKTLVYEERDSEIEITVREMRHSVMIPVRGEQQTQSRCQCHCYHANKS